MVEPLRHRQTKEAATDMLDLKSPRHTSTLPKCEELALSTYVGRLPRLLSSKHVGTSSPVINSLDFGNKPDATFISDRGLFRLLAENLSPGVFRLMQQQIGIFSAVPTAPSNVGYRITTSARASTPGGIVRPRALAALRLGHSVVLTGVGGDAIPPARLPSRSASCSPRTTPRRLRPRLQLRRAARQ